MVVWGSSVRKMEVTGYCGYCRKNKACGRIVADRGSPDKRGYLVMHLQGQWTMSLYNGWYQNLGRGDVPW